MKRYALTLNLKKDDALVEEYIQHHQNVWKEVEESLHASGIQRLNIYRIGYQLFMVMEVNDDFSFADKAAADANNPKVQEWENLMWKYQSPIEGAAPGEKWILMDCIYEL